MRLVTFGVRSDDGPVIRAGVDLGTRIVDLEFAVAAQAGRLGARDDPRSRSLSSDLLTVIRRGERALDEAGEGAERALENGDEWIYARRLLYPPDDVQLLAPLPRPNSLRDFMVIEGHLQGLVDRGKLKEISPEWYRTPSHYKGNVDEIYGPDDVVPWPAYTDLLDYELEICAVIGTAGRRISANHASKHILGYTLYNDWSARDIQRREGSLGIGPGISKDFGSSIGPCIVTPDEFDRDHAHLEARIDGEVWSTGSIGTMHFSFEELIEWTTQEQTLHPGDLLGSGTVGKGCGLELDRWIPQDCMVELEAEGIGVLRNRVGRKGDGSRRAFDLDTARDAQAA